METILFVIVALYAIYLNLRVKSLQDETIDLELGLIELDRKMQETAKELSKDIKACLKTKIIEKPKISRTLRMWNN